MLLVGPGIRRQQAKGGCASPTLGGWPGGQPPLGQGLLEWDFCVRFGFTPLLRGLCRQKGSVHLLTRVVGPLARSQRDAGRTPRPASRLLGCTSSGGALEAPPKMPRTECGAQSRSFLGGCFYSHFPFCLYYSTLSPKSQEENLRRHANLCKACRLKELEFWNSCRTGLKVCPC